MNDRPIYKCSVCGNIVEMLHIGNGKLICCDRPMELLEEKTADAATEKHVPVIEVKESGTLVKVGNIPHPMQDKHYIEWIELITDGISHRKFLKPSDQPEILFDVKGVNIQAREYCSLHGLWKETTKRIHKDTVNQIE